MNLPAANEQVGREDMSRKDIMREILITSGLDHPNVVPLIEFYIERKKVYMVFEMMKGGRLLEVVLKRLSEKDARLVFQQLVSGILYLHDRNVVHRDLKLENILLKEKGNLGTVRIADFGLAKQTTQPLQTMCGTLNYVAPDVIKETKHKKYEKSVDMWSAGVLLYILLSGQHPFTGTEDEVWDKILHANYGFNNQVWRNISSGAKDLIRKLLEINSDRRLTAEQALLDSWMFRVQPTQPHSTTTPRR
ncbi:hypothetical protein BSKO_14152 [Bryopsis sp. KO-2023]|nr:hypothetical protein BSKO_14152 [Bryopsis sp. KO-2023]